MTPNPGIIFVIWRESTEALLIIGILNAWLTHRPSLERVAAQRWLWCGAGAGFLGAVGLAAVLIQVGDALSDEAQEYFQMGVVFVAAALIVQMIFWMRRNGRTIQVDLHGALEGAARKSKWFAVFCLAALAVLREGSETAIFLYGTMAGIPGGSFAPMLSVALGLLAGLGTYWLLQVSGRIFSWRFFFRVTEVMLLFLAASLVMAGLDHLVSLGMLPSPSVGLWDTSQFLPDSGMFGSMIAGLTGYRSKPLLVEVCVYAAYWVLILWFLNRPRAGVRSRYA